MPVSHQPKNLAALGRQWVEAWNTRDLERVLTLYSEEAEMTSDRIPALGLTPAEPSAARRPCAPIGARR
jgi:hypothetical protein